ncbi:hypothetical protein I603_0159 [Erythrobacter dokdonensis DSW-74]|uniref:Uncharacterized protein n=2 Tax=Erythrobacter TaxID=1041 RepID=A0A1A7BHJ8_9SPHN|nr:hypothetical protein I603_0159 [Erythrobacter dokdonensis DSW-74]
MLVLTGWCIAAVMVSPAAPAAASENREAYLERMRAICEVGCLQPRQLLRTARKLPPGEAPDMAVVIDIGDVAVRGDKYLLLQQSPNLYDMTELDFGMPHLDQSPISDRNNILIEMDERTLFDLLNVPQAPDPADGSDAPIARDDAIIVEGDRTRDFIKPSLAALKAMFRNRRIVVRGTPRLDVLFAGARRDRRYKQVTLMLGHADDLVMLPRYDDEGNPILDGPLEGLGG